MLKKGAKYDYAIIIDDNEIDIFINCKMLESFNFCKNIYTHSSGISAIEFLRNLEKMGDLALNLFPEIVFLDLNMPLMDGFQFLEEFSKLQIPAKKGVKVVLLTATEDETELAQAKNDPRTHMVITKPLREEMLKDLL